MQYNMNWVCFVCQPFVSYLIVFYFGMCSRYYSQTCLSICFRHKMLGMFPVKISFFVLYHDSDDSWTQRSTCLGGRVKNKQNKTAGWAKLYHPPSTNNWTTRRDVRSPHFGSAEDKRFVFLSCPVWVFCTFVNVRHLHFYYVRTTWAWGNTT